MREFKCQCNQELDTYHDIKILCDKEHQECSYIIYVDNESFTHVPFTNIAVFIRASKDFVIFYRNFRLGVAKKFDIFGKENINNFTREFFEDFKITFDADTKNIPAIITCLNKLKDNLIFL